MIKNLWIRFLVALWASFMIATVGPALFGDMLTWTAPITCAGGTVTVQSDTYYPRPGETDVTRTPLCKSPDGATTEIPTVPAMGVIWGGGFVVMMLVVVLLPAGWFAWNEPYPGTADRPAPSPDPGPRHTDNLSVARLFELKQAHEAGLISDAEYEQKHKEIVKEM